MLKFWRAKDYPLTIGQVDGVVDPEQVSVAIEQAYDNGLVAPGMTRLFLIQPGTDYSKWTEFDFARIGNQLRTLEKSPIEDTPSFLTVYAVSRPEQVPVVEGFHDVWSLMTGEEETLPYRIVDDFHQADLILSRTVPLDPGALARELTALDLPFPPRRVFRD